MRLCIAQVKKCKRSLFAFPQWHSQSTMISAFHDTLNKILKIQPFMIDWYGTGQVLKCDFANIKKSHRCSGVMNA